jgi:hypothetical protein
MTRRRHRGQSVKDTLLGELEFSRTRLAVQGCTNAREHRTLRSGVTRVRAAGDRRDRQVPAGVRRRLSGIATDGWHEAKVSKGERA